MSNKFLSTVLGTTLFFGLSSVANAQTVNGAINADNRFAVAVQYGTGPGSNTVVHTAPSSYTWGTTRKFSFQIDPERDIDQCRINIAVWGDNSVREGFAGVLTGNNGTVYSGKDFTASMSSANAGGVGNAPIGSTFDAMTPAVGGTTNTGSITSHPTWGNRSSGYNSNDFGGASVPSDFNWIQPATMSGRRTSNYMVFTTPCGSVVKPVARHMPGEHFQCYALEKGNQLKRETILIEDQFGQSKAVLGTPRMLCNPSQKTHNDKTYRIENKERHLVCYDYLIPPKVEQQKLKINNQFAPDDVISTRSQMYCVPSSKKHTDKKPTPKALDGRIIPREDRRYIQRR